MLKIIFPYFFGISLSTGILNVLYYFFISLSIVTSVVLVYRRLLSIDLNKKKVTVFLFIVICTAFPLGYISSRSVGFLYYPKHLWSFKLFLNQLTSGNYHTFHACFFLPLLFIVFLSVVMKFRVWTIIDSLFLHLPIAHAIGRIACLLIGCCWGERISFPFLSQIYEFTNPVPLYSMSLNLIIFHFFLKKAWNFSYKDNISPPQYGGIVTGTYLVTYGFTRFIIEFFRPLPVIYMGLTQAQIASTIFIISGLMVLTYVIIKTGIIEILTNTAHSEIKAFFALSGFLISLLIFSGLVFYGLKNSIITWPFHSVRNTEQIYESILIYSPFTLFSFFSLIWLKLANFPILKYFKWTRFSNTYYIGFFISIGYSFYMLRTTDFDLHGIWFWPPVVILCVLNAFGEEILYRLSFFSIVNKITQNTIISIILQSLLYSIVHFYIGGVKFGIYSMAYGILLAVIREKNKSIVPCIICHFCIDIGNIGLPILAIR